jgi:ribosomal silencing factor RsfS
MSLNNVEIAKIFKSLKKLRLLDTTIYTSYLLTVIYILVKTCFSTVIISIVVAPKANNKIQYIIQLWSSHQNTTIIISQNQYLSVEYARKTNMKAMKHSLRKKLKQNLKGIVKVHNDSKLTQWGIAETTKNSIHIVSPHHRKFVLTNKENLSTQSKTIIPIKIVSI